MSKKKYLFVDSDTICVAQAASMQINLGVYLDGKYIAHTSSQKEFKGKFPDANMELISFKSEPILTDTIKKHIDKYKHPPMQYVKNFIKRIEDKFPDREVWWCVAGVGNYRFDLYPNYKGERPKILLRQAVSDRLKEVHPRVITVDGKEVDDYVSSYCYAGYLEEVKTGFNPYMVSHCDKDINTVAGDHHNYNTDEVYKVTPHEAWFNFCVQLLCGDDTDNIKGVNGKLPPEFFKERGLRVAGKGVGKITATAILVGCETEADMSKTVTECYKMVHGDNWLAAMQEEAIALRMQHYPDERYQIITDLIKHGVL